VTARSRRRDAELAVIDAARQSVGTHGYCQPSALLREALDALQAIDIETADAAVRTALDNPHFTSSQAAEWMRKSAGTVAGQVFAAIYAAYQAGAVGLTCDAVEAHLRRSHQSVSPRLTDLRDKGLIKRSGIQRRTRGKALADVMTPTAIAIEQAKKEGLPWSWSSEAP